MAIEQTTGLVPVWSNIVSIIIGGIIAAGTGILRSIISYRLNRKSSTINLKREKLEQLLSAVYESQHWISEKVLSNNPYHHYAIYQSPLCINQKFTLFH